MSKDKDHRTVGFHFETFYHPYVCDAMKMLNQGGVDGLLDWPTSPADPNNRANGPIVLQNGFDFNADYVPNPNEVPALDPAPALAPPDDPPAGYPTEDLDFSPEGLTAYSAYNWELFFHAPLLIAERLSQNQRFEAAEKWFHYIFNPTNLLPYKPSTGTLGQERFWRFRPFYDQSRRQYETIQDLINSATELKPQVDVAARDPFQPYAVARVRQPWVTFQKAVVMKYLDNLIAWGDHLFRQNTRETLNEAALLYARAAKILGPRPETIPPPIAADDDLTFNDILAAEANQQLNPGGDPLHDPNVSALENLVPPNISDETRFPLATSLATSVRYFCIPPNDKLLGYWDTVANRFYKLRHCMNSDGQVQQLPLFSPPINPDLLVQAAAAGVDLLSAVADVSASLPLYRYATMVQKALEVCNDVKALGGALLAALEKRDAETLAALRSSNEVDLLKAVRDVKKDQIDEANDTLQGLSAYHAVVQQRSDYYKNLQTNATPKGQLATQEEQTQHDNMNTSWNLVATQAALEYLAGVLHLLPEFKIGALSTIGATEGGRNLGAGLQGVAGGLGATASVMGTQGSMSGIQAGYDRRSDDWIQQQALADKELTQVHHQIDAAQVRLDIANLELANHDLQYTQAQQVNDFLQSKFTNADLYDWMVGQISALYFQSYQLAYDLAKRAERAWQYELGDDTTTFITFGYWDSLKQGLLAGERLALDLRRMELAYLDQNRRELEITKHISLAQLDPVALVTLRETGQCFFALPESLYDADRPGDYMRRLRMVSLTVPCVTGPYQGLNGTLTLVNAAIRRPSELDAKKPLSPTMVNEAIAISTGQNDSGGSDEANSRGDDRHRPFEGRGVVGNWRLEIPKDTNAGLDFETVTDALLTLRYTARHGGGDFETKVRTNAGLDATYQSIHSPPSWLTLPKDAKVALFSAAHDFADAWYAFLNQPDDGKTNQTLQLDLSPERFPAVPQGKTPNIVGMALLLKPSSAGVGAFSKGAWPKNGLPLVVKKKGAQVQLATQPLDPDTRVVTGNLAIAPAVKISGAAEPGWTVELPLTLVPSSLGLGGSTSHLDPGLVDDLGVLVFYSP